MNVTEQEMVVNLEMPTFIRANKFNYKTSIFNRLATNDNAGVLFEVGGPLHCGAD